MGFDENDGSEWIGHDAFHLVGSRIMPWMKFQNCFSARQVLHNERNHHGGQFSFSSSSQRSQSSLKWVWLLDDSLPEFDSQDLICPCICLDFLGLSFKYIIAILSVNDRVSFQALPSLQFTMFSYAHPPDVWKVFWDTVKKKSLVYYILSFRWGWPVLLWSGNGCVYCSLVACSSCSMHLSASKLLARKSTKADKMLLDRRDLAYSIRELILDSNLVLSFY